MFYQPLMKNSFEVNDNMDRNTSTLVSQQCVVPSLAQRVGLYVDGAMSLLSDIYILLKTVDTIVDQSKAMVKVQTKVRVNQPKHMDSRMDKAMVMDENNFSDFPRNKIKDHKL